MFPSVTPKTATLTTDTPITWQDGTLFDGYALLSLAFPKDGDSVAWPTLQIGSGKYPGQRLPVFTAVPVSQGVLDPSAKLFFNTSIDPPGTKYACFWLDSTRKRLKPSGEGALFSIAATPFSLTVPTLTNPTTAILATPPEV